MLDFPERCKLDHVDDKDRIVLKLACSYEYTEVALKILDHRDLCKVDHAPRNGYTAIYIAVKNDMLEVVTKLLENPEQCNIGTVCNNSTPLMEACKKGYTDIALQLINYPELCNISFQEESSSALDYAMCNRMDNVVAKMLEYDVTLIDIHPGIPVIMNKLIPLIENENLQIYLKIRFGKMRFEDVQIQKTYLESLKSYIEADRLNEKQSKPTECIICCDDTDCHYYNLDGCSHTLRIHDDCLSRIGTKCPICNTRFRITRRTFLL